MRPDPLRDGAHETVNEWQTSQCVIPKSGHRFSDKITHKRKVRDPEKWTPVSTRSRTNETCVIPKVAPVSDKITHKREACAIDSGFERQGYWGKERESSHDDNGNPLGLVTYWALKSDVTS